MAEEHDLAARLSRVEAMLEQLLPREQPVTGVTAATEAPSKQDPTPDEDPFWALHGLEERLPSPGGVLYAGSVDLGAGPVQYQWGRPTGALRAADWSERAERIAALGHRLRLAILQHLLDGECTVAQLVEELSLASTGVAYHHLNALQQAGWVSSPRRGSWQLPPSRIVPLLAIVLALEEG